MGARLKTHPLNTDCIEYGCLMAYFLDAALFIQGLCSAQRHMFEFKASFLSSMDAPLLFEW